MKIIAGLGNPGPKYETTRHNAGFLVLDHLVDAFRAAPANGGAHGEAWQANIAGEKVLFVKPQTYMNLSGKCIGPMFKYYKLAPEDLVVLHDEIDLPSGRVQIKTGGGIAGHNGLRSIEEHIGKNNGGYHRIRIGVGRPPRLPSGAPMMGVADWVLQRYSDEELKELESIMDDMPGAVRLLLEGKASEAKNRYNRKGK